MITAKVSAVPAGRRRGVARVGLTAAGCVLLPWAGQAGLAGRAPSGLALVIFALLACGGAFAVARRPLTQRHAVAALVGSQLAFHTVYTLPQAWGGSHGLQLEPAASGHSAAEVLIGHVVTVALALRLLSMCDVVVRPLRTVADAALMRLRLVTPQGLSPLPQFICAPVGSRHWVVVAFRGPPVRVTRGPPVDVPSSPVRSIHLPAGHGGLLLV